MINQLLNVGDKIDLFRIEEGKMEEERKQYLSQIMDFGEEDQIKIAMPFENGRMVPLTVGDKYELCFYTPTGLFQCKSEIIDRYKEDNVFLLVVQFTSALEKCQRRQYYRLDYIIDIEYRICTREEEILIRRLKENNFPNDEARINCKKILKEVQQKWVFATATDISGGGIRFNSSQQCKKGNKIAMKIPFEMAGESKEFILKGRVVTSEELLRKKGYYEIRVEFIEMDHDLREMIVKFIFEQERKILRRGML